MMMRFLRRILNVIKDPLHDLRRTHDDIDELIVENSKSTTKVLLHASNINDAVDTISDDFREGR